jgi:microcystin degradation protein MlrC
MGKEVPLIVSLDHHANITQRMVDSVDALVGYQTVPHDPFETGLRTAELLFCTVEGHIRPVIGWRKIPMMAPVDRGRTSDGPMKEWYELARDIERRPGVLAASHFPVHPYLDVPDVGWSAVVVTDGDPRLADRLAAELANKAWEKRADFWRVQRLPAGEAVRRAAAADKGPILIRDVSDSVLAGAPGDGTYLLQEMLRQRIACTALMTIVDPRVVYESIEAGIGAVISGPIGGTLDPLFGVPVQVTGRVSGIAMEGMRPPVGPFAFADMGRSVLLEVGSIKLVVSEFRGNGGATPDIYRRFGVEPAGAKIIVAKTYFYYEAFSPMVEGILTADSPGLSGWDLRRFPWVDATRPLYPLDVNVEWRTG